MKATKLGLILTILFLSNFLEAQTPLAINAGSDTVICPGTTTQLGGSPTATGGTPPYTYTWTPNTNISNPAAPNPFVNPVIPRWYVLKVKDAAGTIKIDSVGVNLNPIYSYNAGPDTSVCLGSSITLGSSNNSMAGGVTYSWSPSAGLNNSTDSNPIATPTATISYSVTISSPICTSISFSITIIVNPLPIITACCPITILEGQAVNLSGTGALNYFWSPPNSIYNPYIQNTSADPIVTTTFYLLGQDINGCVAWDSVRVNVTPNSELIFFNTFSPNGDGINDYFYIGNAYKYPNNRLEVFTRSGQMVYAKTNYDNSWNGYNYGDELPEATYYYIFTAGDGTASKFGDVTIIR